MSVWQTPQACEAHEHLAGLGLGEVDLLDHERLAELLEDGGADLHDGDLHHPRTRRMWRSAGRPGLVVERREALHAHVQLVEPQALDARVGQVFSRSSNARSSASGDSAVFDDCGVSWPRSSTTVARSLGLGAPRSSRRSRRTARPSPGSPRPTGLAAAAGEPALGERRSPSSPHAARTGGSDERCRRARPASRHRPAARCDQHRPSACCSRAASGVPANCARRPRRACLLARGRGAARLGRRRTTSRSRAGRCPCPGRSSSRPGTASLAVSPPPTLESGVGAAGAVGQRVAAASRASGPRRRGR